MLGKILEQPRIDPGTNEHAPELYTPIATTPRIPDLSAVDDAALAFYEEHGYLAVEQMLSPRRVSDALAALDDLIAGRNEAFNADGRSVMFESAAKSGLRPELTDQQLLDLVRKFFHFVQFDERLQSLTTDPTLLTVVSRLMGGRQPKLFQDMALIKPPRIGREKPWHQDQAYFDFTMDTPVVGIWIAFDDAGLDNGCLHFIDGGHKLGPIHHWQRRDWQICDTEMMGRKSVACPLPAGGGVFFTSMLPHGTPTNRSDKRRRAIQLHYVPVDAKTITTEQRLAMFGTEGKDVTC